MPKLSRKRIIVVGAGALGLATAAELAARGAFVEVVDAATGGPNASAIAAGMIAPGLEAGLEGADSYRAGLYLAAAGRWPSFAGRFGIEHICDGADWRGAGEPLAGRLEALGISFEARAGGLHLPGESRIAPGEALAALARNVRMIEDHAAVLEGQSLGLRDGRLVGDAIVLATGWNASAIEAAGISSLLARVQPVKGQLIVLDAPVAVLRTRRDEAAYLVPTPGGVLVGATMEPGVQHMEIDDQAIERLRAAAARLEPSLAGAALRQARAGIRGATPDGLPLAGATPVDGVYVALAPRRNGWLLAPLVAETVAAAIAQEPPPPFADAFRPDRFDRV